MSFTPPPPSSEAIDVKEDHLNNRIIRYFNIPPSSSVPPPSSHSSQPTLTNHRKSKTYALTSMDPNHEMLPATEARQFTNKDTVMYLEPGTDSTALGHEVWRVWYPFSRADMWRESNALEWYVIYFSFSFIFFFHFQVFVLLFSLPIPVTVTDMG